MELHFEPVTGQNREAVLALRTAPGQEGFIETVDQCLDEAASRKCWRPVGIYDGPLLVGFSMYGKFPLEGFPFGRVWLDRLLIDARYQGRGYGKAALSGLTERLRREYRCKKIYLSVIPGNGRAQKLYTDFGFRSTGKFDPHGEEIFVYRF